MKIVCKPMAAKCLLLLLFGLLFFVPDVVYAWVDARFPLCLNIEKFVLIVLLGMIVSLPANKKIVYGLLGVWAAMQMTQFCCMAYFGTYLSPFAVELTFIETSDIVEESIHVFGGFWWVALVVFPPYLVFGYLVAKMPHRFCFKYGWAGFVVFLAVFAARANTFSGAHQMLFKRTCYASFNTINAYTGYFGNILPRALCGNKKEPEFLPYRVVKNADDTPITVFVVYGESVNRSRMSLFGYERDTTPKLKARVGKDKNFVALPAFSAAVNTLISIPTFLNLQREPQNFKKQVVRDTYLPRLAQQNGFHTVYVGFQGESVRQKSALSNIDDYLIYEPGEGINERKYFFDAMKKIDFSKRTFVFLNKRNLHTPFERNYAFAGDTYAVWPTKDVDAHTFRKNSYDNAMLYEDALLDEMMTYLQENVKTPVYFYFIADHGEAFDYKGIWGHGALVPPIYHIPFFFNAFNVGDDPYVDVMKNLTSPTANEIGVLIAQKLGYRIDNPNNTDNTWFVNGADLMGRAGYVALKREPNGTVSETLVQKAP